MYTFGSHTSFFPHFQFCYLQYNAVYCYSIILGSPVKMFYRAGRVPEVRSVVSFILIVVSATQVWVSNHRDNSFLVMFCGTVKDTDPRYIYSSADLDNRIRCNTIKGRHEQINHQSCIHYYKPQQKQVFYCAVWYSRSVSSLSGGRVGRSCIQVGRTRNTLVNFTADLSAKLAISCASIPHLTTVVSYPHLEYHDLIHKEMNSRW